MSSIFSGVFYDKDLRPTLGLIDSTIAPLTLEGTLSFDTSQRYCIGWHDLATGENHACPEQAATDSKYDTCPACQRRTGFNPAFYHATSVSEQQEKRNAEPHLLYLAYMGNGYHKVGISWAKRGLRRLLDQGARSALILDTFPTALIARQYEARIAALPQIHETTPTRTKLQLLAHPHTQDEAEASLRSTLETIEAALKTRFTPESIIHLDTYYSPEATVPTDFTTLTEPLVSGSARAVVGDIIFMEHNDRTVALPLKRYTGYTITLDDSITPLDLPAEQVSLFG